MHGCGIEFFFFLSVCIGLWFVRFDWEDWDSGYSMWLLGLLGWIGMPGWMGLLSPQGAELFSNLYRESWCINTIWFT
jgi:hypothetical protein